MRRKTALRGGRGLRAFSIFHRRPDAPVRLICLPHAGGGASAYRGWAARTPPGVELLALQPPGRENRFSEPPLSRFDDLAASLLPEFAEAADRPYLLFGHSFGALLAHAMVPALAKAGVRAPERLVVSGALPRSLRRSPPDDDALVAELRRLGGTPPQVLSDRALLALALRSFRADLSVLADLDPANAEPIAIPITTFAGRRDPVADLGQMAAWAGTTTKGCAHHVFDGGHFFLHAPGSSALQVLIQLCARVGAAP